MTAAEQPLIVDLFCGGGSEAEEEFLDGEESPPPANYTEDFARVLDRGRDLPLLEVL